MADFNDLETLILIYEDETGNLYEYSATDVAEVTHTHLPNSSLTMVGYRVER